MITTTWQEGLAVLGMVGWLAWGAGCVAPIDTGESPCPCADGWTCCGQTLCVPEGTACPDCDRCERETARCQAEGVQRCEVPADGCADWGAITPCPAGRICELGACRCPDVCGEGTGRCVEGGAYQECVAQADGCPGWALAAPCPQGLGCASGRCVEVCIDECVLDERRCDDPAANVQVCLPGPDGCTQWSFEQGCPDGTVCRVGRCVDGPCGDSSWQPEVESCDGLDNDCDGVTDELVLTGDTHWPRGNYLAAVPIGSVLYLASEYGIEIFEGFSENPRLLKVLPVQATVPFDQGLATNGRELVYPDSYQSWVVLDVTEPEQPRQLARQEVTPRYLTALRIIGDTVLVFSGRYIEDKDASEVALDVYQLQPDRTPAWAQSFSLGLTPLGQPWTFSVAQAENLVAVASDGFRLIQVSPGGEVAMFGPFETGTVLVHPAMNRTRLFAMDKTSGEVRGFDIHALQTPVRVSPAIPYPVVETYPERSLVVTDRFLVECNMRTGVAVYDWQALDAPVWTAKTLGASVCYGNLFPLGGDRLLDLESSSWVAFELAPPGEPRDLGHYRIVPTALVEAESIEGDQAIAVGIDWPESGEPWVLTLSLLELGGGPVDRKPALRRELADRPHTCALRLYDRHAFVAFDLGLWISDFTDKWHPLDVRTDYTLAGLTALEIREDGLLVGALDGSLVTVDVRDPAVPVPLGSVPVCEDHYTISLALRGDTVVMPCAQRVSLVDISDPARPAVLSSVDAEVDVIAAVGDLAVGTEALAWGQRELVALDLSDPADVKLLAPIALGDTPYNVIALEDGFLVQSDAAMYSFWPGAGGLAPARPVDLRSAPPQNFGGLSYGQGRVLSVTGNHAIGDGAGTLTQGMGLTAYKIEGCLP